MSLHATLEAAARLIEREARSILMCHTINGRWPLSATGAKEDYEEMMRVAGELRRAAEYARPNPLGGPARVFPRWRRHRGVRRRDDKAMAEYGLKWAKKKGRR